LAQRRRVPSGTREERGKVTGDAGEKRLALAGHHADEWLKAAESRDFRPIPLGIRIGGNLQTKVREIQTRNVAGMAEGTDPKLKPEVVIYSAHWDLLLTAAATPARDHRRRESFAAAGT
jgi:hypothetical protein